ncbi:hypothetical protein LY76DRAFT_55469 [Colletotrichum caudatum]|nr:hypothetical protein LY76DRAFT_55469 [Colletotrichum caudatum]
MRGLHIKGQANRARRCIALLSLTRVQSRHLLAPSSLTLDPTLYPPPLLLLANTNRLSTGHLRKGYRFPTPPLSTRNKARRASASLSAWTDTGTVNNVNNVHAAQSCPPSPSEGEEREGGQDGAGLPESEREELRPH